MITMKMEGLERVKQALADLEGEYRPSRLRSMLDEPGKVVVEEAKKQTAFYGEIAEAFKKDLGVYRDRRRVYKSAEFVLVGPRFKQYTINGDTRKVAVIAQHLTRGFHQTNRRTKAGQKRGMVLERFDNPMTKALSESKGKINSAMNKGIVNGLERAKAKNRGIV